MGAVDTFDKLWYLITYPLYFLVVVCLFRVRKNPDFNISFYKLVTSLGCVDLLNMLAMLVTRRLIGWGWWSGRPVYAPPFRDVSIQLISPVLNGTSMGQHLGVFLIAIDRFSLFIFPVFHSKLWDNNRLKMTIILHWGFSFCFGGVYYFEKPSARINMTENGTTIYFVAEEITIWFLLFLLIIVFIALVVVISYGAIFIKAIFIAVQDHNDTAQRMALNTVIIGFSISSCLLCFVAYGFLWSSGEDEDSDTDDIFFQVVGDLYTGLNPFCLLIFAASFRTQFKEMFFGRCCGPTVGVENQKTAETDNKKPRAPVAARDAQPKAPVIARPAQPRVRIVARPAQPGVHIV